MYMNSIILFVWLQRTLFSQCRFNWNALFRWHERIKCFVHNSKWSMFQHLPFIFRLCCEIEVKCMFMSSFHVLSWKITPLNCPMFIYSSAIHFSIEHIQTHTNTTLVHTFMYWFELLCYVAHINYDEKNCHHGETHHRNACSNSRICGMMKLWMKLWM